MAEADAPVPATAIVTLVLYSLAFNLVVLALAFGVMAGYAALRAPDLAPLFAAGAGFLALVATAIGLLRSLVVELIERVAF